MGMAIPRAPCRYYLQILGSNVGSFYKLRALGIASFHGMVGLQKTRTSRSLYCPRFQL